MIKVICKYLPNIFEAVSIPAGIWHHGVDSESRNESRIGKEMEKIYPSAEIPEYPQKNRKLHL